MENNWLGMHSQSDAEECTFGQGSWENLPHTLKGGADRAVGGVRTSPAHVRGEVSKRIQSRSVGLASAIAEATLPPAFSLPKLQRPSVAKRRRNAPKKRANLLSETAIQWCVDWILQKSRTPESDLLKLRLSVRAGLRAGEISELPIEAMLDANRQIQDTIEVYASKTNSWRTVTMNQEIREALEILLKRYPAAEFAAFSVGVGGELRRQSASCIANWFHRLYRSVGLVGCSSHSGRRTFATEVARRLGAYQGSLKDLQDLLGHASLSSTECYLAPSKNLDLLVRSLGSTSYREGPR